LVWRAFVWERQGKEDVEQRRNSRNGALSLGARCTARNKFQFFPWVKISLTYNSKWELWWIGFWINSHLNKLSYVLFIPDSKIHPQHSFIPSLHISPNESKAKRTNILQYKSSSDKVHRTSRINIW
jgi:hypothetical protein